MASFSHGISFETMHSITATAMLLALLGWTDGKAYAVYSPSCRMLYPDPFDPSIAPYHVKQNATPCVAKPPLTSVSQVSRSHILHLHKENFRHYSTDESSIECMYEIIRRIDSDTTLRSTLYNPEDTFRMDNLLPLNGDLTFIEDTEFVRVECFSDINGEKVYNNMHAFIGFKESVGKKISKHFESPSQSRRLGVMIVGFDSMSRSNLIRSMPKTVALLERMGWYTLKGYNKIEDNTLPNLMAFLSGKSIQQLKDSCWPHQSAFFDKCSIIWKAFSEKGYITAYAEDSPGVSTFNSAKVGFRYPPTDYYMRPFWVAAEEFIRNESCWGPTAKAAHHIFNYSIDFAACFHRHPTFSLFWHNSFSHNDGNEPSTMDDEVVSYFERLVNTGILNSTMVIFLSDHGLRVGPLRETYIGHIEDRLPFINLWLPFWFKDAYPEKHQNLVANTNALTSPYDIYMTLVEILGGDLTAEGCPLCQSLFKKVPWNRSCLDAGITDHWCACDEYENVPFVSSWANELADSVVREINKIIYGHLNCAVLKLEKILSLRQRIFGVSPDKLYNVALQTTPGGGKFEATVAEAKKEEYWNSGEKWIVLDTVSRINKYGSQSYCVKHYFVKEFCYCPHHNLSNPLHS